MHRLLGSRLEIAFSIGLVAWAVAEAIAIDSRWALPVRLAVALAANVPLAFRHRFPFAVAAWSALVLALDGLLTFLPYQAVTPLEGIAVSLFAVAAYGRPRRRAAATLVAALLLPPVFLTTEREVPVTFHDVLAFSVMQALAVSAGLAVRVRREEAEREAARTTSADAERAAQLHDGLAAERRRIAHELHAIVTRDLSAAARLARRARARLDDDRDEAFAALDAIAETTRAALDELRRLLFVLRVEEGGAAGADALADRGAETERGDGTAGGGSAGVPGGGTAGGGGRERWWRVARSDAVLAGLALGTLVVEQLLHDGRAIGWASGLALVVLPLLMRRRAPLAVTCTLVAGGLFARTALGWMPDGGLTLLAVLVFAPYAAAAFAADPRRAAAGGLVALVCCVGTLTFMRESAWTDAPIVACVVSLSWTTGWWVRGSTLAARLQRRARHRLAAAAPARLHAALDSERRRVARDLHDAVAHGVSLIGLLAGAARATLPRDPARARAALDDLDTAVATTHVELARLLEALRAGTEPEERLVSVEDLDAIVTHARRCGQLVELRIERAALAAAPASARGSVCRIVQEALTNARKHAPGAEVAVAVLADGGQLRVEVVNDSPPARVGRCGDGAGRGIEGMRERARLLGGELEAGPTAAGGFAVRALLPAGAVAEPARAPAVA